MSAKMLSHLTSRNLQTERYTLYYDDETCTFPFYNLSNQFVGFQQYRPDADKTRHNDPREGRYYTYCKDKLGVWGMETFYYRNDILFLTEGVFDACRLHNLNLPAIAVISNDPKPLRSWLRVINRKIVTVCDPGEAGKKLAKFGDVSITMGRCDLGDSTEAEVLEAVKDFI